MQKKHTIDDLNRSYTLAIEADKEHYSECRSNVMIVSGHHYSGKNAKTWSRIRETRDIANDSKLRLTKNHVGKISKTYVNHLLAGSPGAQITPRNEKEIQDQKAAQLHQSVWQYSSDKMNWRLKVISFAKDYVDLGETAAKVYWNPNAGDFKGYNQLVDEMGQPVVDEMGQPKADEKSPVFSGQLEVERICATNLFRDANAASMDESPFIGVRKMVPMEDARAMVGDDEVKLKMLQESQREEYMVFNPNSVSYAQSKGMVLFREYYFRPCMLYPKGYFYITTQFGILFEGELPFGIFPIKYAGFDEIQGSPRHRSIVRQLRPYQMEINRTASKIAETQVTSDTKIMIQSGSKVSSGAVLPGVRAVQYTGQTPTVIEGSSGGQYIEYMNSQISEMYSVADLTEETLDKVQSADPMAMLFKSAKQKKKFSIYSEKFEAYLKDIVGTHQALAKQYFTDDMLIPAIGKAEYVNIPEFRSTEDIRTQIKIMPMSDDINEMFGKWFSINHAIQYVGQNLGKDDIGRLMRQMPYGNFEESFGDFTIDYDNAQNFILALERGEDPKPSVADNKLYMVKRLEKRIRESDWSQLDPQIQQRFMVARDAYIAMDKEEKMSLQRAEQGFIPTDGALVSTDLKVEVPNANGGVKTIRAPFPVSALQWLHEQLQAQGSMVQELDTLPQSAQAEVARSLTEGQPQETQPQAFDLRKTIMEPAKAQGVPNGLGKPNQFAS